MPMHFLNADLELTAEVSLDPVIEAFGDSVVTVCHEFVQGQHFASFETSEQHITPEAAVAALCHLVSQLPPHVRDTWRQCTRRIIDLGFERERSDESFEVPISTQTLRRVSELQMELGVTVYGSQTPPQGAA